MVRLQAWREHIHVTESFKSWRAFIVFGVLTHPSPPLDLPSYTIEVIPFNAPILVTPA